MRAKVRGNYRDGHFTLELEDGTVLENGVLDWHILEPMNPNSAMAFEVVFLDEDVIIVPYKSSKKGGGNVSG